MTYLSIPIFPLNGVILFPKTNLPLNIFEKRYLKMVDYSLRNNKLIGMIQTKTSNELYSIGCVGKINSFNETEDGRYLINIHGQSFFKIIKEISSPENFRIVDAEIIIEKTANKSTYISNNNDTKSLLKIYAEYIKDILPDMKVGLIEKF